MYHLAVVRESFSLTLLSCAMRFVFAELGKIALALSFGIVLAELISRLVGLLPVAFDPAFVSASTVDHEKHLVLDTHTGFQKDPMLGWRLREGSYRFQALGREISKVVWSNESRATTSLTPSTEQITDDSVLFFGDSLVHGSGLSDHETAAWILQSRYPSVRVFNFGAGGYGLCHVFYQANRILGGIQAKRLKVIVGLSDFLILRNTSSLLADFDVARNKVEGSSRYPNCKLTEHGEVVVTAPRIFTFQKSLLARSAFASSIYRAYLAFQGSPSSEQREAIITTGLLDLKRLLLRQESEVLVFLLSFSDTESKRRYKKFLREASIPFIDGRHKSSPEYTLPDTHPNEKMNREWADILESHLF